MTLKALKRMDTFSDFLIITISSNLAGRILKLNGPHLAPRPRFAHACFRLFTVFTLHSLPLFRSLTSLVTGRPSCSFETAKASPVFTRRARTDVTKRRALAASSQLRNVGELASSRWTTSFIDFTCLRVGCFQDTASASRRPSRLPSPLLAGAMAPLHLLTNVVNSDISFNGWGGRGTRSAV